MSQLAHIGLDLLVPCPRNPRRPPAKAELEELAASLKARGQLQPIVVRPIGEGCYEIAAGHRRFLAAQLAGFATLEAIVRDMPDPVFYDLVGIENLQHQQLSLLEEADAIALVVEAAGSVKAAAARLGNVHSLAYIQGRLRIRELAEPVRAAVDAKEITIEEVMLIARMAPGQQAEVLEWMRKERDGGWVMEAEDLRKKLEQDYLLQLGKAPFDLADADLVPAAGPCSRCPKRSDHQAALFADLKGGDRCLDRDCWQGKVAAQVARTRAKFEKKGEPVVLVSTVRGAGGQAGPVTDGASKPVPPYRWEEAKASDRGAVKAILADGPKAGQPAWVKIEKPAKPAEADTAATERAKARDRARQVKLEIEGEAAERLARLIAGKSTKLGRPILELVIADWLAGSEAVDAVEELFGWPQSGYSFETIRPRLAKLSERQLVQAVVVALGRTALGYYGRDQMRKTFGLLEVLAKPVRVNAKKEAEAFIRAILLERAKKAAAGKEAGDEGEAGEE